MHPPAADEVDPVEAKQLTDAGALLLDVREPDEWHAGRAPGAVHVPLGTLPARTGELPQDRTIVVVCRSGHRSGQATKALRAAGYDARNLAGGMKAWLHAGLPVVNEAGAAGRVI